MCVLVILFAFILQMRAIIADVTSVQAEKGETTLCINLRMAPTEDLQEGIISAICLTHKFLARDY